MVLDVDRWGEGRPLVVLPSFRFDHHAMAATVEPVFARTSGWARLYVDLPGTGESAPVEPRSDAVLDAVVETIGSTLGDQRFVVAGWSYGGYLAAGLARRLPRQIAGLMMICTGFKIGKEDRDLTGVLRSTPEPEWLVHAPTNLHDHFAQAIGRQTAAVARRVAEVLALNGPAADDYLDTLQADGYPLTDEHKPTSCEGPVSFVAGRRDRLAGYAGPFGALEHFSAGDYLAIGNAGHYLPLEQPELFKAAMLTWLENCRPFVSDVRG